MALNLGKLDYPHSPVTLPLIIPITCWLEYVRQLFKDLVKWGAAGNLGKISRISCHQMKRVYYCSPLPALPPVYMADSCTVNSQMGR